MLSKVIQDIVRQAKYKDVSGLINGLKERLESALRELFEADNLRVMDKGEGGVLRGPIKSRSSKENRTGPAHQPILLLCDKAILDKENKEVSFMRGLFNKARSLGDYSLVAYETPLMRKKSGAHSRAVSCDLLGVSGNEMCCIEIKTNPDPETTRPQYALIEAFAYGVCLNWLTHNCKKELLEELNLCYKSYLGTAGLGKLPQNISFAVAAPQSYFKAYAKQELKGHGEEWFLRRKKESKVIEKAIKKHCSKSFKFAGYFSIPYDSQKIKTNDKYAKDHLICPMVTVKNEEIKQSDSLDGLLAQL